MQKLFLALILLCCQLFAVSTKNASDYLKEQGSILASYYQQVKKQSQNGEYPLFRGRKIIEHSVYSRLQNTQKDTLKGQLVLSHFILKDFIKYSNLGGVGIGGILAAEAGDRKAQMFYLKFDGRYLSDLEFLGIGSELYAYCVLPNFNQCILLGIGEDWK